MPGQAQVGAASVDTDAIEQSPSLEEVREIYTAKAASRTRPGFVDRLLKGRYRCRQFARAEGRVLDVACGMGSNYPFIPGADEYVGVDVSDGMLETTIERYDELQDGDELVQMDAGSLGFPDDSFDAVVSSFSTCEFPDPEAALEEMGRVCRPDGRILLLEHGRSDVDLLARYQDWRANTNLLGDVCRWNQDPTDLVWRAGLELQDVRSCLFGIVKAIEARPPEKSW